MKKINQHIINQINVDVKTASEAQAFGLKSSFDKVIYDQFLPRAEVLFDEVAPVSETLRYDSVELEIQLRPEDDLEHLNELLMDGLREKLNWKFPETNGTSESQMTFSSFQTTSIDDEWETMPQPKVTQPVRTEAISDLENIILFFLETGQLPWYAKPSSFSPDMENSAVSALIANKVFLQRLMKLLSSNPNALERFVQQISPKTIIEAIGHFSGAAQSALEKLEASLKNQKPTRQKSILRMIIQAITEQQQTSAEEVIQAFGQLPNPEKFDDQELEMHIQELLQSLNTNPEFLKTVNDGPRSRIRLNEQTKQNIQRKKENPNGWEEQLKLKERQESKTEPKVLYIQNAGLILTHPFLPQLLSATGCLDEQNQLLPDSQQKAVQLLHYLSTRLESDFEFNMLLEKYLCGMPLQMPLSRESLLCKNDLNESDDLLRSVIKYWPELKNTSPDGLRQLFFDRAGKLDFDRMPHKLYVERKAQDVLLDKLQWNISVVKLPWMKDLLFVEW